MFQPVDHKEQDVKKKPAKALVISIIIVDILFIILFLRVGFNCFKSLGFLLQFNSPLILREFYMLSYAMLGFDLMCVIGGILMAILSIVKKNWIFTLITVLIYPGIFVGDWSLRFLFSWLMPYLFRF